MRFSSTFSYHILMCFLDVNTYLQNELDVHILFQAPQSVVSPAFVYLHFGEADVCGFRFGARKTVAAEGVYRALCVRCARAVRALCEKLAVLHHRDFGKFRRLKGRH